MARARILKPGFFSNAKLSALPAFGRLLFAGLWTLADRKGLLRDEPRWIKGTLFPFDNVPVDKLLGQLAAAGFITRYAADGERFIQIINFEKHQRPHQNEAVSVIPMSTIGASASTIGDPKAILAGARLDPSSLDPSSLDPSSLDPVPAPAAPTDLAATGPPTGQEAERLLRLRRPIFKLYEDLFGAGSVNPLMAQKLQEAEEQYPAECLEHCFDEAAASRARNFKFVEAILKRHQQEGCYAPRRDANGNGAAAAASGPSAEELLFPGRKFIFSRGGSPGSAEPQHP